MPQDGDAHDSSVDGPQSEEWPAGAVAAKGRAAWPELAVDEGAFSAWLAERFGNDATFTEPRGADLCLVFACGAGNTGAIRTFERQYFDDVDRVLRSMSLQPLRDEVKQLLRVKLFLSTSDAPPSILEYSGRGDLRAWFRVVAVRIAINLRRTTSREAPMPDDLAQTSAFATTDPELASLRDLYRADFVAAFRDAISALTSEERVLLRLRYVERVPILRIGPILGIHRTTATRRLEAARDGLISRTRSLLGERLRLRPSELESLLRVLEHTVDVDLAELLATP